MSTEANKHLARRFREELTRSQDPSLAAELLAADYVYHGPALLGDIQGPEGFLTMVAGFNALADQQETVEDQVAEGDRVTQRFRHRSVHAGEVMGAAPTGKPVTMEGIEIHRIADGHIAETWIAFDALGMLQQLGVLPPLG